MKHLRKFNEGKEYTMDQVPFAVAHHLGNPVDAIDSGVYLAKKFLERGDVEKAKECLNDVEVSIEKAKQIIQDFKTGEISFK
jgi:phosphoglycerate-specific signal transduction histidine kinase